MLLLDLLVCGCSFYRVKPSVEGSNLVIDVLNPLNTFVDRNPESPYVKDSYRVVVRKWMTKQQILVEYGKDLQQPVPGNLQLREPSRCLPARQARQERPHRGAAV